jgi:hypothetical protein
MLETFCVAANIKRFLQRSDCPKVIQECKPILEQCWGLDGSGTLKADMRILGFEAVEAKVKRRIDIEWAKRSELSEAVFTKLQAMDEYLRSEIPAWSIPTRVFFHERHNVRGTQYATRKTSKPRSTVFFQPEGSHELVPGVIQEIFSVPIRQSASADEYVDTYFLVIQRYLALEKPRSDNVLLGYTPFGASLWCDRLADAPEVVLATSPICECIGRPWAAGVVVLKPMDRVSGLVYKNYHS